MKRKKEKKMVIAWQYYKDMVIPEVSTTSEREGLELSQTHTQTDRHGYSMTELVQWGRFSDFFLNIFYREQPKSP